jgi:catechol-2,3-dioxygenase
MDKETTLTVLEDDLLELETEISRQRLIRERSTYRLEQAVRERDRLARHVEHLIQESEGAA